MIEYRPFRNSDPPQLARIWTAGAVGSMVMRPISVYLLDQFVLAKPYFDRAGLTVALDDGVPVGFAHAGFGPNKSHCQLTCDAGVTCVVMVLPEYRGTEVPAELLARSEAYLESRGAKVFFGGALPDQDPFYLGICGSTRPPGVLDCDEASQQLFRAAGYQLARQTRLFRNSLYGFRPLVDRQQMQIRRQYTIHAVLDPPTTDWWEACTEGELDRIRYDLVHRATGSRPASMTVWSSTPLQVSRGEPTAAVLSLDVVPELRRQGLATFLVGESLKHLLAQGITQVEAAADEQDIATAALLRKLGFRDAHVGSIFRKQAADGKC